MGLFSNKKGTSGNSGHTGGGFTATGAGDAKRKVKAIRKEWTGPSGNGGKRPK